ncbi:MAG: alpha/beta fold hydrolase [Planctomycetota bacterium]
MQHRVNDLEIHFELSGPEDADVVTFSHAFMADSTMWDRQLKALDSFRCLRYDIRGHGKSEATEGSYDLNLLAMDLLGLLDHLQIESTHFVGSSLGAMIGLELAFASPERLASLTLCNTRGNCTTTHAETRREWMESVQSGGVQSISDSILPTWFSKKFLSKSIDDVERAKSMIEATSTIGYLGCTQAMEGQDHSPRLSEIKLPSLIVVGEDDPTTPLQEAFDLHVGIDGSDMVVIPKARHLATMEASTEFNDVLATFLKQYS